MTVKIDGTNTVANPAFTGADTDTGLQCGTNELKLVTGGSARATVTSDGDIGVGIASPTTQSGRTLHLHNNVGQQRLHLTTNNTGSAAGDGLDIILEHNTDGDAHILNHETNGDLKLGAGDAERVRLLSTGGMTFNGDTAQANALNDYEEGSWTATLVTGTCTSNSGKYIKIGNLVRVSATLYGFSNRTSTNLVQINNAPFASSGAQVAQAAGSMFARYMDRTAFTTYMSNTGLLEFYSIGSSNWASLHHDHLNNAQTSMYFQASWYID